MAKKKTSKQKGQLSLPRRLIEGLYEADQYLEEGHPEEARRLLVELNQKYPGQAPVLELLVNDYYDLKDMKGLVLPGASPTCPWQATG